MRSEIVLNAFRHLICWNAVAGAESDGPSYVLNAFRHLICWNSPRSWTLSDELLVLNAFRHLICWNSTSSPPTRPPATRAQRLSASYMLEHRRTLDDLGDGNVLNAFRHLICWNRRRRRTGRPCRCAQRLSASYMLELHGVVQPNGRQVVLNAFRHLICWNHKEDDMRQLRHQCSTPFGILYVGTRLGQLRIFPLGCAQRLSASYMLEPPAIAPPFAVTKCSTPFGILYVGTPHNHCSSA